VREEINELRRLLQAQQMQSSDNTSLMQNPSEGQGLAVSQETVTSGSTSAMPSVISSANTSSATVSQPTDLHAQMMLMMAESFSELSSVLAETKTESKSDWPKFLGESRKFRDWYLTIMMQVSLPPWNVLYDPITNDVVVSTTNTQLKGKLYSKIILSLEGKALKHAVSRKHLHANGLLLLQELTKTYKPTNVPEVIAAKTVEFWGHTKCQPQESIDQYYDCFHELLDDLQEADEPISTRSAIRHFIFTLGHEFEPIQNNFRVKVLPSEWYQEDWPTILAPCRDYYNPVKPQSLLRKETSDVSSNDRLAHQKKIRD
jgi:hypothetical protein